MCFPPFCEPAHHVLGCISLRHGAAGALLLNAVYGLCLVVIHALLLGEGHELPADSDEPSAEGSGVKEVEHPEYPGERRLASEGSEVAKHDWFLEMLDLDIGWGHNLLGFDDFTCLLSGLCYGVIVVLLSAYMLHAVMASHQQLAISSRWYVAFLHLEMVLYIGLVIVKMAKLCRLQEEFYPGLQMDCPVLRYVYAQRAIIFLILAALCCWVFSSLSYFQAYGYEALNNPAAAQMLDMQVARDLMPQAPEALASRPRAIAGSAPQLQLQRGHAQPFAAAGTLSGFPPVSRGNAAFLDNSPPAHNSRHIQVASMAPIAEHMNGHPGRGAMHSMHSMNMAGAHPSTMAFPRNTSSRTSTTDSSNEEKRLLIRPPVVIH